MRSLESNSFPDLFRKGQLERLINVLHDVCSNNATLVFY